MRGYIIDTIFCWHSRLVSAVILQHTGSPTSDFYHNMAAIVLLRVPGVLSGVQDVPGDAVSHGSGCTGRVAAVCGDLPRRIFLDETPWNDRMRIAHKIIPKNNTV